MTLSGSDHRNIALLKKVLRESHDPHRPVGAIIADAHGRFVADGTNAPPTAFGYSVADTHAAIDADPAWKYFMLEHAERNAIFKAQASGISLKGATMYGTLFPCADCARAIAASGIRRIVVPEPGQHSDRDQKWIDHYRYARKIIDLSGIALDYYSPTEAD
jgi:dCMP deaminase